MIITVTMNPAIDKTVEIDTLKPGGLNRIRKVEYDAGGKGINVSKTIQELGGTSVATGFLGGNAGRTIESVLNEKGIQNDFIMVDGETRTNTKVFEQTGEVTELNEPGPMISDGQIGQLMEKLSPGSSDFMTASQSVLIDLSSWYRESLAPKIETIRAAIDRCRLLEFLYYAPASESMRVMEPYYLIFRWSSWYVWGWCRKREDFRLFKLNRMESLCQADTFSKKPVPLPELKNEHIFPGGIRVKALFDASCKWRLVEEFGTGCFEEQPDGRLLFHADYTGRENLLTWLLTFREQAELLEPEYLREELQNALMRTLHRYRSDES